MPREAKPPAIDYHHAPSEAEQAAARRRTVQLRDKAIRWVVVLFIVIVVALSIFLYTFPYRILGNGYSH